MRTLSRSSLRLLAALLICGLVLCNASAANAGTLVTMDTNMGTIQVDLFNDVVPGTVTNFLNLVTGGNYSNTIIHRSEATDFVIQGGGFNTSYAAIANNGKIPLEYKIANSRGTIAMARTGETNTATATSQWFINSIDNSTGLGPGGFTPDGYAVFGWVVSGMNVVDAIEHLPVYNMISRTGNGALNVLPLQNYTQEDYAGSVPLTNANLVIVNSISIAEQHASFQNPLWDADVNNDGSLTVSDIMPIVNGLLAQNGRFTPSAANVGTTYKYFDTSGDGVVSVSDLMRVVNAILRGDTAPASSLAAPLAAPLAVVPEPSTFALITMAIVAVGTIALRRRRSRTTA